MYRSSAKDDTHTAVAVHSAANEIFTPAEPRGGHRDRAEGS